MAVSENSLIVLTHNIKWFPLVLRRLFEHECIFVMVVVHVIASPRERSTRVSKTDMVSC